jgi:hypothetical protein
VAEHEGTRMAADWARVGCDYWMNFRKQWCRSHCTSGNWGAGSSSPEGQSPHLKSQRTIHALKALESAWLYVLAMSFPRWPCGFNQRRFFLTVPEVRSLTVSFGANLSFQQSRCTGFSATVMKYPKLCTLSVKEVDLRKKPRIALPLLWSTLVTTSPQATLWRGSSKMARQGHRARSLTLTTH